MEFMIKYNSLLRYAQVAELADAQDLKSCGSFSRAGSTPALSTKNRQVSKLRLVDFTYSLFTKNTCRFLGVIINSEEVSVGFLTKIFIL